MNGGGCRCGRCSRYGRRVLMELMDLMLFVHGGCHHLLMMMVVEVAGTQSGFVRFQARTRRVFVVGSATAVGRCVQRMMGQREHAAVRRRSVMRMMEVMVVSG